MSVRVPILPLFDNDIDVKEYTHGFPLVHKKAWDIPVSLSSTEVSAKPSSVTLLWEQQAVNLITTFLLMYMGVCSGW